MISDLDQDEARVEAAVSQALRPWLGQVAETATSPVRRDGAPVNTDAPSQLTQTWQTSVDDQVMPVLTSVATDAFLAALGGAGAVAATGWLLSQLATIRVQLLRLPAEVADLLRATVSTSAGTAQSVPETADAVRRVLSWDGADRWPARARAIAITAVTEAVNAGIQTAGLHQASVTGVAVFKRWRTRMDGRERPAHHAANGQTVPISYPFVVGEFPMMYPGDVAAPADLVVNCRCRMSLLRS